ncbi:MAG: hypothetical protein AABZ14_08690 [Candidatus Margulisiibacteriota bacterium]
MGIDTGIFAGKRYLWDKKDVIAQPMMVGYFAGADLVNQLFVRKLVQNMVGKTMEDIKIKKDSKEGKEAITVLADFASLFAVWGLVNKYMLNGSFTESLIDTAFVVGINDLLIQGVDFSKF